ncbi:hypothetical protein TIFTF001_022530 [Ficus carica]|uniref:Uncharacterized protein n=1 Tax=Ficus carica TaxID=3494 RepID=A0AA88DCX2_FICCA|nr:hypothetical protein TIFTF001_022530 [Ficus carica]
MEPPDRDHRPKDRRPTTMPSTAMRAWAGVASFRGRIDRLGKVDEDDMGSRPGRLRSYGGVSVADEEIRCKGRSSSQATSMAGMVAARCSPPPTSEDRGVRFPLASVGISRGFHCDVSEFGRAWLFSDGGLSEEVAWSHGRCRSSPTVAEGIARALDDWRRRGSTATWWRGPDGEHEEEKKPEPAVGGGEGGRLATSQLSHSPPELVAAAEEKKKQDPARSVEHPQPPELPPPSERQIRTHRLSCSTDPMRWRRGDGPSAVDRNLRQPSSPTMSSGGRYVRRLDLGLGGSQRGDPRRRAAWVVSEREFRRVLAAVTFEGIPYYSSAPPIFRRLQGFASISSEISPPSVFESPETTMELPETMEVSPFLCS